MKPTPAEIRALSRRDPALGQALRGMPEFPGFPAGTAHASRTFFHSLVRSIIFQMLTGRSAETIYRRVRRLTAGRSFPRPAELLDMSEERLRGCGLSRDKARAIRDLALRVESGKLKLSRLGRLPDEEIIVQLTAVRGIGVWTVQMFLIFRLGRLDVMPLNDVGIQEGIRRLDDLAERPDPRDVRARSEPWRPLASVASWALWRLVDGDG